MPPKVRRRFSHLPLRGTPLQRDFTSVVGVREDVLEHYEKKPRVLRYLVILYTEKGEGLNRTRDRRTPYRPGSLTVQPRGLVYDDRPVRLPWRMRYLLLVGPMADEFQAQFWPGRRFCTYLYDSPPPAWGKRLIELIELTFDQPPDWSWRFLARLGELFEALLNSPPSDQPHENLLDQTQRLIEADMNNPWRLEDLAAALRIDAKTLSRRFQRIVEQPPALWVRRQRMKLAVKFLHQGMSVVETANQFGFRDPSCFSRQFKTVMSVSPSSVHRAAPERP